MFRRGDPARGVVAAREVAHHFTAEHSVNSFFHPRLPHPPAPQDYLPQRGNWSGRHIHFPPPRGSHTEVTLGNRWEQSQSLWLGPLLVPRALGLASTCTCYMYMCTYTVYMSHDATLKP